jgi:hypothetical protein
MTTTSTRMTANRLTAEDRARIAGRIAETIARWERSSGNKAQLSDRLALYRLAVAAIGCSDADLRQTEADEIHAAVAAAIPDGRP